MPSCFMIMPYGRKATQADPTLGPAEIDFNALWDRGSRDWYFCEREFGARPL
jgi:hypothetical protein